MAVYLFLLYNYYGLMLWRHAMSEVSNNDSDNSLDLSKFYDLDIQDEKAAFRVQNQDYFSEVASTLSKAKNAKAKLAHMQVALKAKVLQLKKQIEERNKANLNQQKQDAKTNLIVSEKGEEKNASKQQSDDEDDLLKQDLAFCQRALVEGLQIDSEMAQGISTLENISATGEKQPYKVIVGIALKPLPSDRSKEKNNDKNKEGNESEENMQSWQNAQKGKITAADMKNLRNGEPLHPSQGGHKQSSGRSLPPNMKVRDPIRQSSGYGY